MKRYLVIILLFTFGSFSGQTIPAEYLNVIKNHEPKRQAKMLDSIATVIRNDNVQLSLSISRYNLNHSKKYKLPLALVKTYLTIGRTYRGKGSYDSALMYTDSAKNYAFANKVSQQYGNIYDYEGLIYMRMGDYPKASASFYKSISYSEEENDSIKIRDAFDHLGTVHFYMLDYKTAANLYKKSQKYAAASADKRSLVLTSDNIGLCYSNLNMFDSALYFQRQAVKALEELSDSGLLAEGYVNIGSTLLLLKNYDEAKIYLEKAFIINERLNNEYGRLISNLYIGRMNIETGNPEKAIPYLATAFDLAEKLKLPSQLKETSSSLADAHEKAGNYKQATFYMRKLVNIMQDLFTEENTKAINELSAKYETEKKQQQIQLLTKDKEIQEHTIQNDRYIKLIVGIIAVMLLLVSVIFIYRFREKKKDNQLLREKSDAIAQQKNLIEKQKEELQFKNTEITDSINYAKRIQGSVLPSEEMIRTLLPDSFIYFRPKDIVSGDFYWASQNNDLVYFAVADCTGHGVPGAMMSMLGTSLLNQIVLDQNTRMPSDILRELNILLVKALNENMANRSSKDGMDIALIAVDRLRKKIYYSGAGRPLYLAQKNELRCIRADKFSIGSAFAISEISYQLHEVSYEESTTLYLFSDGVPDQFGGNKGKKFMTKQLQGLIQTHMHLPVAEQSDMFRQTFENWKKGYDQTDDITFAGIRIT